MLLRLSLVVSILAGGAALYFTHFKVSEKISTLTSDLNTSQTNEQTARQARQRAEAAEQTAKDELESATQELAVKTEALQTATASLTVQKDRADRNFEDLTARTRERNQARQELSTYKVAGLSPEQILGLANELNKISAERDAFIAENGILLDNITQLEYELSRYTGTKEPEVELPVGLKGRIVAVDPRYDFVVLNIGGNQGVLENGKMLVNRDGRLVAKVRITKVEPDRCIANILPEWKQAEVSEGDQVLY